MTRAEITTAKGGRKADWSPRCGAPTEELKNYTETKKRSTRRIAQTKQS